MLNPHEIRKMSIKLMRYFSAKRYKNIKYLTRIVKNMERGNPIH